MSNEIPTILLLEDTRTVQNYIRDVLRSLPREHKLLTARKVEEAQILVSDQPVDLFIVDLGLPDGDGLDFLCDMATFSPESKALIITSNPNSEYRDRARQLGVFNILAKPLQRKALLEAVVRLLGQPEEEDSGSGFEVTLGGLSPSDIIQLKCMSGATGALEFSHGEARGIVFFSKGEVVHAESWYGEGHEQGPEAFKTIIGWRAGVVSESGRTTPDEQTIFGNWQSLLMEAAQAIDEGAENQIAFG
jgi:DNA-binding response OmpR family regulator